MGAKGSAPATPIQECLPEHFEVKATLGEGAFGIVLHVLDKNRKNKPLALKVFRRVPDSPQQDEKAAVDEASRLTQVSGQNVAKIEGFGYLHKAPGPDWLNFWLAVELCDDNLAKVVESRSALRLPLSKAEAANWLVQLAVG